MTQQDVIVALVGRPWDSDPDAINFDLQTPYEERLKVTLPIDEDQSLAAILSVASELFKQSYPGDYSEAGHSLAFYQGNPSEQVQLFMPATTYVTTVSDDGLAVWHVPPSKASVGDLVKASEAKVFKGDPLRPYLVVDPKWRMAGGAPGGWDNFLQIWDVLYKLVSTYAVLKEGYVLSTRAKGLLDRATAGWRAHRQAAEYTRAAFEARNADIMDVIETARAAETYRIADIMQWTGIEDPAVAADVAGWAGYQLDESSGTLSLNHDRDFVAIVRDLPITLSINGLSSNADSAEEEASEALLDTLRDRSLLEPPDGGVHGKDGDGIEPDDG